MNLQKLQEKLWAVARQNVPSDKVPYAFEKRIMARLAMPIVDIWTLWSRALWRAAAASVLAMALLGGWSLQTVSSEKTDLSQDFENTVFAALDDHSILSIGEEAR